MFPEHVERSFLDPEYSFDEYFQLGSGRNIHPIKNRLNEAFWTQNIASSQFDEYPNYIREAKVRPIKNQLYSPNTPNYVREQMFAQ